MHRIVVWDPRDEVPEGEVVAGPKTITGLETQGVVLLPVDEDRVRAGPVDGYFRRSWGFGWRLNKMSGERCCPMLLHVKQERPWLYWAAGIAVDGDDPQGFLRLTTDTSRQVGHSAGLGSLEPPPQISEMLKNGTGGCVVRGVSKLSVNSDGFLSLSLYAVAKGVSVVWSAVSQSSEEAPRW